MRLLWAVVAMLFLAATNVDAKTIVRLDYTGGSTAQAAVDGNQVQANISDLLSFDIVVEVGANAGNALSFDLSWMSDTNLKLQSTSFAAGTRIIPGDPSSAADLLIPDAPIIADGMGLIGNIGWEPNGGIVSFNGIFPSPTPLGEIFLGSVIFHVTGAPPSNIHLGFLRAEGSSATSTSNKFYTPGFSSFRVKASPVPEPGLASLLLLGLSGLWVAGRRRPAS